MSKCKHKDIKEVNPPIEFGDGYTLRHICVECGKGYDKPTIGMRLRSALQWLRSKMKNLKKNQKHL